MKPFSAIVISNEKIAQDCYLLWINAPDIDREAKPGQFVMVRCGAGYQPLLRRPLSIHKIGDKASMALLFETKGEGTRWLAERSPDEHIDLLGPLGMGFTISPDSRKVLMLAGGIGIAPLVFLAEEAISRNKEAIFILGLRGSDKLDLKKLVPAKARLVVTTEDGSSGRKCLATDMVPEFINEVDQVFACGPVAMYQCLAGDFGRIIKDKPVSVSMEERMACGFGACLGCTIKTRRGLKQVCRDGPVFELNDIVL